MMDRDVVTERMEARPDDELLELLARRDENEWEPEVFAIVEDILRRRGLAVEESVAAVRAALPPLPDPDADVRLVTVASFWIPIQAQLCHAHLEQAGFSPLIVDEHLTSIHSFLGVAAGGIRVQVPEDEADEAMEFLKQEPPPIPDPTDEEQ